MKNRRLALVAFLLCACMIVGVGYAAVITSLTVDGKVSFDADAVINDYAAQIHFTGNTKVQGHGHSTLPANEAILCPVQSGDQKATLSANFTSANIQAYKKTVTVGEGESATTKDVYVADVIYEVEVVLPAGAEKMVVTFGDDPQVSGHVSNGTATNAIFQVTSYLYENGTEKKVTEVTVDTDNSTADGTTRTMELHVRIEVPASVATGSDDFTDVAFEVLLPVTGVEITPAA